MANWSTAVTVVSLLSYVSFGIVVAQEVDDDRSNSRVTVERLTALPDSEGFAGSFAGVTNEVLLVAGGANFPRGRPWQGGKKVWYDQIFRLEHAEGTWIPTGKLPRPLGYGVSVSYHNRLICVGGNNAEGNWAEVFSLSWLDRQLQIEAMPPLPKPLAHACATMVGDWLYVAGGQNQVDGPATDEVWRMDLSRKPLEWESIECCPGGGRMLAVAASRGDSLWVVGGVKLAQGPQQSWERQYLDDVWHFRPSRGWQNAAPMPLALAAAPSPAPVAGNGIFVLGGDDGTQVRNAPQDHRGFNRNVLRYDIEADQWRPVAEWDQPRVTTPCVFWSGKWVIPSGEMRPGVRSPDVSQFGFRRP